MLPLTDPRWKSLRGGYKIVYDASEPLRRMQAGENVWDDLWENLHHQGDLGDAAYAAVPHLVEIGGASARRDWNFYGLLSVIEVERHRRSNPEVPDWLAPAYEEAWARLLPMALADLAAEQDGVTLRAILGVVALAKGARKLGALMAFSDESQIAQWLDEYDDWSEVYR
jgi:hypothetical protein